MLKKIKKIKTKTIIIASIIGLFFVGSTIFLVISNIKLYNTINTLLFYVNKIDTTLSIVELKNDESFPVLLKNKTGLEIDTPEGWTIESSLVKYYRDVNREDRNFLFRIVFNMNETYTYDDFTSYVFDQASKIAEDCYGSDVESWKDGYYAVNSFSETTSGNIYYDLRDKDTFSSSTRHKIKIIKDGNQAIVEVDKF
jgi:hypothetical protein